MGQNYTLKSKINLVDYFKNLLDYSEKASKHYFIVPIKGYGNYHLAKQPYFSGVNDFTLAIWYFWLKRETLFTYVKDLINKREALGIGVLGKNLAILDFDENCKSHKFLEFLDEMRKITFVEKTPKGYHVFLRTSFPKGKAFYKIRRYLAVHVATYPSKIFETDGEGRIIKVYTYEKISKKDLTTFDLPKIKDVYDLIVKYLP